MLAALVVSTGAVAVSGGRAQEPNPVVVDIMGVYASWDYVTALMNHCWELDGFEASYKQAADDWFARNIAARMDTDAALTALGGDPEAMAATARFAPERLMEAPEAQADPIAYCAKARDQLTSTQFDLDSQFPEQMSRIRGVTAL